MILVRDEWIGLVAFILWQEGGCTEDTALTAVRQAVTENRNATLPANTLYDPAAEAMRVIDRAHDILGGK